jgi:hypothetical protein
VQNLFELPGSFLKGNLHTHTTNSDGKFTPQQAVDHYREAGYDFLALTDHRCLTPLESVDHSGIVLLPGMELHPGAGELGQTHHLVAIGMETEIDVPKDATLQAGLDLIVPLSRFAFIAHPYWTSLTYRDLQGLTGPIGLEVFNSTCEFGIGRGDSAVHWDELLARGERLFGFAVDDAHCHYPDTLGGWTMVRTDDGSAEGIIEAILAGSFYASRGPSIEDVTFAEASVTVRCSPCQAVYVICPAAGCGMTSYQLPARNGPLTEVTLPLSPDWNPIRLECVDERGRKAWTNPFWR